MPRWIRRTRRWAIYLRDDCACVYCGTTLHDVLHANPRRNFMTLDHVSPGRDHRTENLVTCCYDCNHLKNGKSVRSFCERAGLQYSTIRSRIHRRKAKDLGAHIEAARVLLGLVSPFPAHPLVRVHDWIARKQWENDGEVDYYGEELDSFLAKEAQDVEVPF